MIDISFFCLGLIYNQIIQVPGHENERLDDLEFCTSNKNIFYKKSSAFYNFKFTFHSCVHVLGKIFDEKRHLVVRGDGLGDPDPGTTLAARQPQRQTGGRKLQPLLRRRWPGALSRPTGALHPRSVRPSSRVLSPQRVAASQFPRNSHVFAKKEHGIPTGYWGQD